MVFADWVPAVQQSQSIATLHLRDPIGCVCSDTFIFYHPGTRFWCLAGVKPHDLYSFVSLHIVAPVPSCSNAAREPNFCSTFPRPTDPFLFYFASSCRYLSGFLHLNLSRRGQGYCVKKPSTPHAHDLRDRPPVTSLFSSCFVF